MENDDEDIVIGYNNHPEEYNQFMRAIRNLEDLHGFLFFYNEVFEFHELPLILIMIMRVMIPLMILTQKIISIIYIDLVLSIILIQKQNLMIEYKKM
ncbi:MAG: hypothetical protein H9Q67_05875 [Spiroplasma ixodetis]|nr:hypothetical protein [Spiroplasma ixodetis]